MRDSCALLVLFFCPIFPATLSAQTQAAGAAPVPSTAAAAPPASAPSAIATAADPQTPAEFFARARQLSDLEAAGIPFHLKATFVASGDAEFKGNGNYEEWWEDKDHWRQEATVGDFRLALINNQKSPVLYASSRDIPESVIHAMGAALTKVGPDLGTAGDWRMKGKKIGGVRLTIVSEKPRRSPNGDMILPYLYYFTSDGILRIQGDSQATTVYNDVRPFQGLLIPRTIETKFGQQQLLKVSIETLEPLRTDKGTTVKLADIPNDLPLIGDYMVGVPRAMAGNLVSQPQPIYPAEAKWRRIQGRVLIGAVIDENGNMRDLHVIASPDKSLSKASLDAVHQWRYKPTIVDGKAVAVYTTVTVVFTLNE
jgi:TonB family protein